jgi:hypothetical protein
MQVKIVTVEGGYLARVTPSHGDEVSWTTGEPMSQRDLINKLAEIGFHQQDIGDAFYEGDPAWLSRPESE